MSQDSDSFDELVKQWTAQAEAFTSAMQEFFSAATRPVKEGPSSGIDESFNQWGRAVSRLATLQAQTLSQCLSNLPRAGRDRLDAQSFSQLDRMARANWEEEIRRFSEIPFQFAERAKQADAGKMARLFESMMAEYAADLQNLKPEDFVVDFKPLAGAWAEVLSGSPDDKAARMVERFLQAMTVKAKYGSEYYADPENTVVGQTPHEVVYRQGSIELHHYQAPEAVSRQEAPPVLIVYSVINKPYILDLVPGYSFIEHLLSQGLDVYLVDWGPIEPGDRETSLDGYIDPGIKGCVEEIKKRTGSEKVSLFGHCIGGNLALMYAALYPEDIARIIILTTPITAAEGGVVALWTDRDVFPVDEIIESFGHMPAKLIRYTFMALKPYYEVMKWKMFMENLGDDQVMALFGPVDRWANENVDIPGDVFRKFIKEVFHDDRFRRGETRINGKPVDLSAITCPLMNLAATRDWIVPLESAEILGDLVGSREKHFIPIEGAHVGIMIDPRSRPHWTTMSDFLRAGS